MLTSITRVLGSLTPRGVIGRCDTCGEETVGREGRRNKTKNKTTRKRREGNYRFAKTSFLVVL